METGDARAVEAGDLLEAAADENFSVGLGKNTAHNFTRAAGGIEGEVKFTTGLEAGDSISRGGLETGEDAADQDFAILLQCKTTDAGVRADADLEGVINGTIGVKSGNAIAFGL